MSNHTEVRNPTPEELDDIAVYLAGQGADSSLLEQACIAVFPHFISDGPGYVGPVIVIVWSGGPDCTEVLTYELLLNDKRVWTHTRKLKRERTQFEFTGKEN